MPFWRATFNEFGHESNLLAHWRLAATTPRDWAHT